MSSTFSLWVGSFLNGLAELVFATRPVSGLLVAAGLLLISPWLLLGAALGCAVGTVVGYFRPGADRAAWAAGLAGFNPAIIGILWAGNFTAGFDAQVLFAAVLVICVLAEPVVRRVTEPLSLLPFSAPALIVTVLASLALAPAGTWFWTGTTDRLFGAVGVWAGLACMAAAMAVSFRTAAAWAVSLALAAYLILQWSGLDIALHAGLWGLTVPLSCFAAMTLFSRRPVVSRVAGLIAAAAGTLIWFLWIVSGLSDHVPPLIAPLILGLWTAAIVVRRCEASALLREQFWATLTEVRNAIRSGGAVIALTGASDTEAAIFEEFMDAARSGHGGSVGTGPEAPEEAGRIIWELGDRIRRASETAVPEPVHLAVAGAVRSGMVSDVAAGDALGLMSKVGCAPALEFGGQAGRVRCRSCGARSDWPPAGLWRRLELRCAQCSGALVPDLQLLAPKARCGSADLELSAPFGPGAMVLAVGCDPKVVAGSVFADRLRETGIAVRRLDDAPSRPGARGNDMLPGVHAAKALRRLVMAWRVMSWFDIPAERTDRTAQGEHPPRRRLQPLSPLRSEFAPWLAAAVLAAAVLAPQVLSGTNTRQARPVVADLSSGATGEISFQSHNSDLGQLEVGGLRGLPVTIAAELTMPDGVAGRVPAVVLMHGSLGLTGLQHRYADELTRRGYAVMVVDSFGGRNIADVVGNQTAVDGYSMMIDAFAALGLLATHPGVDPQRIALVGWSKGGGVAQLALTRRYRDILARDDLAFAAHVAIYPWCGEQESEPRLTGAPILYLLGGADDWVGTQPCVDYARRLAAGGYAASWVVYPQAEHGFDDRGQFRMHVSQAVGWGRCQYFARADGFVIADTAEFRPWPKIDDYLSSCTVQGTHMATHSRARTDAMEELTRFLARTLR